MFVIGSGLGWAAVVLLVLFAVRGVQRWRQLLSVVADIVIDVAEALDQSIGERLYQTGHWVAERRFLRSVYNPLFQLSWRIEQFLYDHEEPSGFGLQSYAAASPIEEPYDAEYEAYLDYLDDLDREEARSVDDYRYDY